MTPELLAAARLHDELVARSGLSLWIGAEPTFTRRDSQDAPWLFIAEGGDKEQMARELLRAIARQLEVPARLFRAEGRLYPGEQHPRFSYGALWTRGGKGPIADDSGMDAPPAPVPPWEPHTAWLTVTPDPGVVEVNLAPAPDLETFAAFSEAVYRAAAEVGLTAERFRFNGQAVDSGGGGQITLGGPTPEQSPFFLRPQLLPSLLRYLNHHPALSYAFATECVGSASQGPRSDEGVRERFEELQVALDRLAARGDAATPEELWQSLAPLLVDSAGNSHRAELNVEKLWNPFSGARGKLGLVELRSLRMAPDLERMVALAALFRSLAARFALHPFEESLVEWGSALHERFALPHFLREDLQQVLAELDEEGLGLPALLAEALLREEPPLAEEPLKGATLLLRPALEFWPLLGDVASQEQQGARLFDPSTQRVQIELRVRPGELRGRVSCEGWEVPLQRAGARGGQEIYVGAVRYRAWEPNPGLHPGLRGLDPLEVIWERGGETLAVALHGWLPGGGAYPDLPADAQEAQRRRAERVVARRGVAPPGPRRAPSGGEAAIALDLRRLPAAESPAAKR
ncbi:MAG TPA: transglutaminase family protein [Myxococcaceae bacterium]|nr:transglutaminase family protein [Myxococcaceae bacterium]